MNIITYNVLSSELANEDWFANSNPEFLKTEYRMKKLEDIFLSFISDNCIICLQEVSDIFSNLFSDFFSNKDYQYIDCVRYQKLGIAIAIPNELFVVKNVFIRSINEYISKDIIEKNFGLKFEYNIVKEILSAIDEKREILIVKLCHKDTTKEFIVSTIHFPCKYTKPFLMLTYCVYLKVVLSKLVDKYPIILTGDFNSNMNGLEYEFLTKGTISKSNPFLKDIKFDDICDTLAEFNSIFPETNFTLKNSEIYENTCVGCQNKINVGFTLDYIFYSKLEILETKVLSDFCVEDIPEGQSVKTLPSESFPSDHFPLYAKFQFN